MTSGSPLEMLFRNAQQQYSPLQAEYLRRDPRQAAARKEMERLQRLDIPLRDVLPGSVAMGAMMGMGAAGLGSPLLRAAGAIDTIAGNPAYWAAQAEDTPEWMKAATAFSRRGILENIARATKSERLQKQYRDIQEKLMNYEMTKLTPEYRNIIAKMHDRQPININTIDKLPAAEADAVAREAYWKRMDDNADSNDPENLALVKSIDQINPISLINKNPHYINYISQFATSKDDRHFSSYFSSILDFYKYLSKSKVDEASSSVQNVSKLFNNQDLGQAATNTVQNITTKPVSRRSAMGGIIGGVASMIGAKPPSLSSIVSSKLGLEAKVEAAPLYKYVYSKSARQEAYYSTKEHLVRNLQTFKSSKERYKTDYFDDAIKATEEALKQKPIKGSIVRLPMNDVHIGKTPEEAASILHTNPNALQVDSTFNDLNEGINSHISQTLAVHRNKAIEQGLKLAEKRAKAVAKTKERQYAKEAWPLEQQMRMLQFQNAITNRPSDQYQGYDWRKYTVEDIRNPKPYEYLYNKSYYDQLGFSDIGFPNIDD